MFDIKNMNVKTMEVTDSGMADTGASVCLAGSKLMRSLGLTEANLAQCDMRLYGADNTDIQLLGVVPVIITDTQSGHQTRQFLYVCSRSSSLLLCLEACIDLKYVSENYPTPEFDTFQFTNTASTRAGKRPDCDCKCPVRETAPDVPTELPLKPTLENVPRLEQWIRDHYAA